MNQKMKNYYPQGVPFGCKNKKNQIKILIILIISFIVIITVSLMRKTITVNIDGEVITFVTYKSKIQEILDTQGIDICNKDKIEPSITSKVKEGATINIKKAVPISLEIVGQKYEILTAEDTIENMILAEKDFIKEHGGNVDDDDEITPAKETKIEKDISVKLVQVQINEVTEEEPINYEKVKITDENKDIHSPDEITQVGINGTKNVGYKIYKYEDGTEKKIKQSETIINMPQDEIISQGGGYFMPSRGGSSIKILQDTITMTATAYYEGFNAITKTGRKAVRSVNGISTIAVDPRVIPLGSLVYVEGYGKAIAADTGSAIKGNIIDLYLNSTKECVSFGRQYGIEVGIIAFPGEW